MKKQNKSLKVLCVYATRQIDSNLFMSSTVFNGLQQCGYEVDIVFMGTPGVVDSFRNKYGHYFHRIYEIVIPESRLKRYLRSDRLKLLYSFYLHFFKDGFWRPYKASALTGILQNGYDCILSFVPPPISGLLAYDVRKWNHLEHVPLVQFWSDPLSLGRCDDISDIPVWRYFHKKLERRILRNADRAVFVYPLLCEMEQRLYPEFANKMTWSDVSYVEHPLDHGCPHNKRVTIGLFGAYQRRVRNIQPLLAVLSSFPEVQFIFRGDSDMEINAVDYPNLDIQPGRRPAEEVEQLEAQCDILLSLGGLSGVTTPAGKTMYYANYDKPIVVISDGVHKKYFTDYLAGFENRYITCDNNTESICSALQQAIAVLPDFQLHIPKRMNPARIAQRLIENME